MKTSLFSVLLIFCFYTATSQANYVLEWSVTDIHFGPSYNPRNALDNIFYLDNGNILTISGGSSIPADYSSGYYECKMLNNQGELLWIRNLEGGLDYIHYLKDFFIDQDNYIILLGIASNQWEDTYDISTDFIKLSITGETIFNKSYQSLGYLPGPEWTIWNNTTVANKVAVTGNGDYIIAGGATMLYFEEGSDYEYETFNSPFISKFNNQGEELWTLYDSIPNIPIHCFIENDSTIGNIHFRQDSAIFYKRNTETGQLLDSIPGIMLQDINQITTPYFSNSTYGNFIRDNNGNILIRYNKSKVYKISKINTLGEILWEYQKPLVETATNTYVMEMAMDPLGYIYCLGNYEGDTTGMLLTKLDSAGNLVWEKQFNLDLDYYTPRDLDVRGHSIYIAGNEDNPDTPHSAFILKYNSNGDEIFNIELFNPEYPELGLIAIDVAPNEDIYFFGNTGTNSWYAITGKLGKVTNLNPTELPLLCKVFPNPFTKNLSLEIQGESIEEQIHIKLFDLQGKQVYNTRVISNKINLDLTHIPPGNYQISIKKGSKEYVQNLVKSTN